MAAVKTVKVSHDGTAKALITNVTDPADKEFTNRVTPPTEPKFQTTEICCIQSEIRYHRYEARWMTT